MSDNVLFTMDIGGHYSFQNEVANESIAAPFKIKDTDQLISPVTSS